jgi:hypothetical protein
VVERFAVEKLYPNTRPGLPSPLFCDVRYAPGHYDSCGRFAAALAGHLQEQAHRESHGQRMLGHEEYPAPGNVQCFGGVPKFQRGIHHAKAKGNLQFVTRSQTQFSPGQHVQPLSGKGRYAKDSRGFAQRTYTQTKSAPLSRFAHLIFYRCPLPTSCFQFTGIHGWSDPATPVTLLPESCWRACLFGG